MTVIGVTGTDGKTTTTEFVNAILEASGKKTALINGLRFKIGDSDKKNETNNSTPGRFTMQRLLAQAWKSGCTHVVIEVTSIGLIQHRLLGVAFDAAVFINLSSEHMDVHKTMDRYKQAKARLFKKLKAKSGAQRISVVNADDAYADFFHAIPAEIKVLFSESNTSVDVYAQNPVVSADNVSFDLVLGQKREHIELQLHGGFNIANALAAASVCYAIGVDFPLIKKGLESVSSVTGRAEHISEGQVFSVVVDYGHTPQAFEAMFEYANDIRGDGGRVIAVFGSAGGRDHEKRPELGRVASEYADFTVLTTDDPRKENPKAIAREIITGFKEGYREGQHYMVVIDRYWAIRKACEIAKPGDVVLILGMGAADMYVDGKKVEWDDRKVVRTILNQR